MTQKLTSPNTNKLITLEFQMKSSFVTLIAIRAYHHNFQKKKKYYNS